MPQAPLTPCRAPGCGALLSTPGYCERHRIEQRRRADRARPSAARRGYDAAWQRLRKAKLEADPFCECDDCQAAGLLNLAEVVDHIIPIEEAPELRLEWSNLRSMTETCHNRHTARTRGFGRSRR